MSQEAARAQPSRFRYWVVPAESRNWSIAEKNKLNSYRDVKGSFENAENVENDPEGAEMLKVMAVKSLVTMMSGTTKSGNHKKKKWLTGSIFIKWNSMQYFKVEFRINFIDDRTSLTVCLLKSKSLPFYEHFKFQSCTISIKFQSKKTGMELFKAIHLDEKEVCFDFDHRYDDHIASVTNGNFSELADLEPYFKKTSTGQLWGLWMEMSMELHVRALRNESRYFEFNFPPRGPMKLEPRKDTKLDEEPRLKRMRMEETHADVEIKVGPRLSHTFKAHRCVLEVQSSVLVQALTKLTGPSYELNLAHVQAKPMSVFISMMYDGENQGQLGNDFQLIFDVLDLAEEFKVAGVTNQCVLHLVRSRSTDHSVSSVLLMHLKGCQLKILDLQFRALQIAFKKKDAMFSAEGQKILAEFCQEHPMEAAKYSNGILGIH